MAKSKKNPKGYSLHIGLNSVNPKPYGGWTGLLNASESDANDMADRAQNMKPFSSIINLLTKRAAHKNTIEALKNHTKLASKGDFILFTYSGHGGRLKTNPLSEK